MSEPVLRQAYVLHARKYRDTSLILELLTRDEGRVAVVARGARGRKSRTVGSLQPFSRILVSWFGRADLKTAKAFDFPFPVPALTGDGLLLGMYINELLLKVLGKFEPAPGVFDAYGQLLADLGNAATARPSMRRFEILLLAELGYGISFATDAQTGTPVDPDAWYRFEPDAGFRMIREPSPGYGIEGSALLAMARNDFTTPGVESHARRVIRAAFAEILGERQLKSRDLFRTGGLGS